MEKHQGMAGFISCNNGDAGHRGQWARDYAKPQFSGMPMGSTGTEGFSTPPSLPPVTCISIILERNKSCHYIVSAKSFRLVM